MQKEKLEISNLLVIVDDLNIDFGKIRLRGKGSAGGHNGLKHIEQLLGAQYARLRFGIGDTFNKGKQIDYVLGEWSNEECEALPDLITKAAAATLSFGAIGLASTMTQFNK